MQRVGDGNLGTQGTHSYPHLPASAGSMQSTSMMLASFPSLRGTGAPMAGGGGSGKLGVHNKTAPLWHLTKFSPISCVK